MALTTDIKIRGYLGPASVSISDPQLTALRQVAEASIQEYCGRLFERATYTEYYTGNGTAFLPLRQRPVASVTSVHLDHTGHFGQNPTAAFESTTLLTGGVDYSLRLDGPVASESRSGILVRISTVWPEFDYVYRPGYLAADTTPSPGSIKVVYVGGYLTIPETIQYAVCLLVSYLKRTVANGTQFQGEKIGDYSYHLPSPNRSRVSNPDIGSIQEILSHYREVAW